jgi:hypothetical protein
LWLVGIFGGNREEIVKNVLVTTPVKTGFAINALIANYGTASEKEETLHGTNSSWDSIKVVIL